MSVQKHRTARHTLRCLLSVHRSFCVSDDLAVFYYLNKRPYGIASRT
jgi:hypothetical protein